MKNIFLLSLLVLNFTHLRADSAEVHRIVRRAALDVGSGGIRIQVSDIDIDANQVTQDLYSDAIIVHLREQLAKSQDGMISQEIQNEIVNGILYLKNKAEAFHPQEYHAIATESFRLANNQEQLVERIQNESGILLTVISQEEEGILGFHTAVNKAKIDPNKAVTWEVGGGSFQITAKSETGYLVYRGKLGRVPMKNALLTIQGKSHDLVPNPVSKDEAMQAIQFIKNLLSDVPKELREKILQPDTTVLAIGLNPLYFIEPEATTFTAERLAKEIEARLNLDSAAIQAMSSNNNEADQKSLISCTVSSLLMAYGIMDSLGIQNVHYQHTPGGNASGVFLSPQFWEKEKPSQLSQ